MAFGDNLEALLPAYLVSKDKDRLKQALGQFVDGSNGAKVNYEGFYLPEISDNQFMQSDLVRDIRFANWNNDETTYEKAFTDAIIISNSCDISPNNPRGINKKECLFAPIIPFSEYIHDLQQSIKDDKRIQTFIDTVKSQHNTNIFYLPSVPTLGTDYIAVFDNIFTFPTEELNSYLPEINQNKISCLSQFGYYLFILKLSYHLCRLPEELDRN